MSKDYKAPNREAAGNSKAAPFAADRHPDRLAARDLALLWRSPGYINKMPTPFLNRGLPPSKGQAEKASPRCLPEPEEQSRQSPRRQAALRFLQDTARHRGAGHRAAVQGSAAKTVNRQGYRDVFLQAGAFQSAPDADNLKARLALLGMQASVQTTTLPDKGVLASRASRALHRGRRFESRARDAETKRHRDHSNPGARSPAGK